MTNQRDPTPLVGYLYGWLKGIACPVWIVGIKISAYLLGIDSVFLRNVLPTLYQIQIIYTLLNGTGMLVFSPYQSRMSSTENGPGSVRAKEREGPREVSSFGC